MSALKDQGHGGVRPRRAGRAERLPLRSQRAGTCVWSAGRAAEAICLLEDGDGGLAWPRMTEKAAPVEPAAHEQLWRVWPGLGTQQRGRDTVEMGVAVGTEAGVL